MPINLVIKGARGPQSGATYSSKNYLKRIQVGTNADGSPKYRYIRSPEELQAYLADQEKEHPKESQNRLKDKLDQEQKESKRKTTKDGLLGKSLRLYIEV